MDINNELKELKKYMFIKNNIQNINNNLRYEEVKEEVKEEKVKQEKIKVKEKVYKDYLTQKLLEIIELENKNSKLIELINTNQFNYKMKTQLNYYFVEKLQLIQKKIKEKVIEKPKLFKMTEVITELGNEENMTLTCFIACCYIEKINLLLVNKKVASYIEHKMKSNNPELYYVNLNKNEYSTTKLVNYDLIKNNYYFVNNIIKPFKSVGSYKADELKDIAEFLNINITKLVNEKEKNKTKQEIYNEIIEYVN